MFLQHSLWKGYEMRFKLIGGNHQQDGKTYKTGDIVESKHDLAKAFKGQFERIYEQESAKSAQSSPPLSEGRGKNGSTSSPPSPNGEGGAGAGGDGSKPSEFGDDVTEQFPDAVKAELKVYATKGGWFTVVDPDGNKALSEKKLRQDAVPEFLKQYVEA